LSINVAEALAIIALCEQRRGKNYT